MGIFSKAITNTKNYTFTDDMDFLAALNLARSDLDPNKLKEAVYFTCMRIMTEAIAKIPIKIYKGDEKDKEHQVYKLLALRPNPYMTPSDYAKAVEFNRLHWGHSVVVIDWNRRTGELRGLYPLNMQFVKILVDDASVIKTGKQKSATAKLYYLYTDPTNQQEYLYRSEDVLHFKGFTPDGIIGKSVRSYLGELLENAQSAQQFTNKHFKEGLMSRVVVQYTGDINETNQKKFQEQFTRLNGGTKNAGKIIPIPLGFQMQSIDNKLVDSQFLDLKKLTAREIAAAFGVKPHQINDLEKSSYSAIDALNQQFYIDTLLPVLTGYEQEYCYKLFDEDELVKQGYRAKFNVDVILRATLKDRMAAYASGIQNGVLTPADARAKEDLPFINGSDVLLVNGNMIPVQTAAGKGGENSEE